MSCQMIVTISPLSGRYVFLFIRYFCSYTVSAFIDQTEALFHTLNHKYFNHRL